MHISMPKSKLNILYEDNHLLAVLKPAGMATMGVSDDKPSLLSHAKDYIKCRYNKPGNVYLGVMSRLDAPVTGVVLFARTSKAAARLTEQFRTHAVEKIYWAVVEGSIGTGRGQFHRLPRQGRISTTACGLSGPGCRAPNRRI